jgi:hypothetical protein
METGAGTPTGWLYRVFESSTPEIVNRDEPLGAYLRNRASTRFLQKFFDPLCEPYGVGISTSDDEVVQDPRALGALRDAIREAINQAQSQPESWNEVIGYTFEPFQTELGDPIEEQAHREPLLAFLRESLSACEKAIRDKSQLIWAGGE